MNLVFKPLEDSQLDDAFSVLTKVGQWLESQGRRQRISRTTFESYAKWQSEKANFVVTIDDRIVGLVTSRNEQLEDWPDVEAYRPAVMIRALATDPDFQRAGIGKYAMNQILKWIRPKTNAWKDFDCKMPVYLDCVSDTLPNYYSKFGFLTLCRHLKTFDDGETFDLTLMRRYITP